VLGHRWRKSRHSWRLMACRTRYNSKRAQYPAVIH
jgi:hypothetical protein